MTVLGLLSVLQLQLQVAYVLQRPKLLPTRHQLMAA